MSVQSSCAIDAIECPGEVDSVGMSPAAPSHLTKDDTPTELHGSNG